MRKSTREDSIAVAAALSRRAPRFIADPLHPETPPAKNFYPRAGTQNAKVRLGIVARAGGENVYVQHCMRLADTLFNAGKTFNFLPLLGTHMVSEPLLRLRRQTRVIDFFDVELKATVR